jgi:hypothetical protein
MWQVQSAAACGTRGSAAGGRAVVGLPHGARSDVGAAQVGREVPLADQRRRHTRVLAATQTAGVGGAEAQPARVAAAGAGVGAGGEEAEAEVAELAVASDHAAAVTSPDREPCGCHHQCVT